jgi:hypothetical protein
VLLVQANGRLRAVFRLVKKPEKLPVIFPIPSGIVHVDESFVLDFVRDFVERRESITRRRRLRAKLFLFRQTQRADAGKNFQPRQKEPRRRRNRSEDMAVSGKIDQQVGNDEDCDGSGLLGKRTLKTAQGDCQNSCA